MAVCSRLYRVNRNFRREQSIRLRHKRNRIPPLATHALHNDAREPAKRAASSCLIGLVTRGITISDSEDYRIGGHSEVYVVCGRGNYQTLCKSE
jgi:hypothetical protein